MNFSLLNLKSTIVDAISAAGYTEPTEIQSKAIPEILSGFDVRASAQTGTGKTAAFLLPALQRLLSPPVNPGKGPRVLILAPTRELAMQILTQANKYSKNMRSTKAVCVVGGIPYPVQTRQLVRPYDILIATPGRLIDYLQRGKINLSRLELLILDEADRMLDMGFVEPIESIVAATPATRQTLLFSATMGKNVLQLSDKLLNKPLDIVIEAKQGIEDQNIAQQLLYADDLDHKNRLLDHILSDEELVSAVVFTSTKMHTSKLVDELKDKGYSAAALHGDMTQKQRSRTLTQLRDGKFKILVATDVAARGIDVKSITHVVNFDLPRDVEDYVHRIGRTGRAGASGKALSFATRKEASMVERIQKFTGREIPVVEIAGLEPRSPKDQPRKKPSRKPFRLRAKTNKGGFKGRTRNYR